MDRFKKIFAGILLLLLASCATVSQSPAPNPEKPLLTWNQRVNILSSMQTWDVKGAVGVNNLTANKNISASLEWQQQVNHYQIFLSGPLGAGAAVLTGQPGAVELKTADGQLFKSSSPEKLLAEQTNWMLPVSNLYYWIRGLPVPSIAATKKLDARNRLSLLTQQGWQIQYPNYLTRNDVDLPAKLILTNAQFHVKIIIKQW